MSSPLPPPQVGERLTFTVRTHQGAAQVTGTLVAENLAYHRPVGQPSHFQPSSVGNVWDLSQISSGRRIGRFLTIEAATFYAEVAAKRSPSLASGEPIAQEEGADLVQLRRDCGGWAR